MNQRRKSQRAKAQRKRQSEIVLEMTDFVIPETEECRGTIRERAGDVYLKATVLNEEHEVLLSRRIIHPSARKGTVMRLAYEELECLENIIRQSRMILEKGFMVYGVGGGRSRRRSSWLHQVPDLPNPMSPHFRIEVAMPPLNPDSLLKPPMVEQHPHSLDIQKDSSAEDI